MTGYIGDVAWIRAHDLPAVLNQRVGRFSIRDEQRLDRRFLFLLLRSAAIRGEIAGLGYGSAQPNVSPSLIHGVEIPLPPLPQQRAIAHILGTLDDKIELIRRMNETLEAMARTLFQSWFVDFDGETEFVESEADKIPRSWTTRRLRDLVTIDKGLSYKGQYLADTGIPLVNLGCFKGSGHFDPNALKFYQGEHKAHHIVRSGDIVMANTDITQKREVLGSPAVVPPLGLGDHLLFTHHVFALRFLSNSRDWTLFTYYLFLQNEFRQRAVGFATGTTVLGLPKDAVLDLVFVVPPIDLVANFNRIAWPLVERCWSNNREAGILGTLRDTLLPKLISGELRIKDAERFLEKTT
jgi:type I restriction enzyme S subunit